MISLIVCSIDDKLYEAFSASVARTIGISYEIIRVDNRVANKNLGRVYNEGAAKARYDHLLFVHEDVLFSSSDWGKLLLQYFNDLSNPGIIAVMGSDYISYVANGWYVRDQSRIFAHLVQHYKYTQREPVKVYINSQAPAKIFTADGVFMALTKQVWQTYRFDEALEGFHGYDLSLALRVSTTHQNYFVPGITLTHLSEGKFDAQWFRNNLLIRQQLFPSLTYLKEKNKINRKIERLLLFESFRNINALDIPPAEKKQLRKEYFSWAVRWLGFARTYFIQLKAGR